jgi:hypothetical protein
MKSKIVLECEQVGKMVEGGLLRDWKAYTFPELFSIARWVADHT